MKQFIFIIFVFANFLQFFGCTNLESVGQSSRANYEANVRILDDWKVEKGFEFLLDFVPKARFKVEMYNISNPKLMFEGEYKEIDKKHHIIFKNIPWDSEKEKKELGLKIGIGPDEIGFGQIIKRKFNEEISIISAKGNKPIDENVDENSIIEPKTENEIEAELQNLFIPLYACYHQKFECDWQSYYINKQKINLINKLISINQFIVNGGNSNTMDSEPLIRNAKLNIEKRRLELNNLMESTRRMYLPLIQKQYDWQSKEGWAVGPSRPSIPDNLLRSLFPTMCGVHFSQTAPAALPSPSNFMGMNTPTNAQIPFPPSASGPGAPLRTSSTGGIGLPAALGQPRPMNLRMNTPTNAQIPIPASAPGAPLRTSTGGGVEIPVAGQLRPINFNASPTFNRSTSQTNSTDGFLHPKFMKELFPPPNQPSGSQQIRSASTGVDLRSQTVGSSMQMQMPLHGSLPQQQNPSQLLLNKMEFMEARLRQMGAGGDGRSQMAGPTAISPHQSHIFGGDQRNLRQIIPDQNNPNPQIQFHPSFVTGGSGKELSGGSRGKGKGKKQAEISLSKHFPPGTDQPDTEVGGSKKSRGKGKKTGQDMSAANEPIGSTVEEIPKKRRSGRPPKIGQGNPKRRKQKEKQGEGSNVPLIAEDNHPIGAIPIRSIAMPNPMMDVDRSHPPSAASARNEGEDASQDLMQEGVGESQM